MARKQTAEEAPPVVPPPPQQEALAGEAPLDEDGQDSLLSRDDEIARVQAACCVVSGEPGIAVVPGQAACNAAT
eukprot:4466016-Amphidinium_carterae.1